MLISFKIKNFRSFKEEVTFTMEADASKLKQQNVVDLEMPKNNQIRLLKIAMAFGANASGKTNIIRAFYEIINHIIFKPQVDSPVRMYKPFLFNTNTFISNSEFELCFIGPQNIKYIYKIVFNANQIENESLTYYPNGTPANVFTRNSISEKNSNIHIGVLGENFNKKKINVFKNQLLLSKFGDDEPIEELTNIFLYLKNYSVLNAANKDQHKALKNQIDKISFNDKAFLDKLNALIKFADVQMKGFMVHNMNDQNNSSNINGNLDNKINSDQFIVTGLHPLFKDDIDTGENWQLPFEDESTGTRTLYGLGGRVLMTLERGGVLIVDELDTSLHPFLTRMLVMMFQSEKINPKGAQLIFTSHDMTLLDRELVRRDQVWIAEKNEMGISDIFSLQDFEGIREETPFDKWYLAGKFGGLPQIKSIDSIFDGIAHD